MTTAFSLLSPTAEENPLLAKKLIQVLLQRGKKRAREAECSKEVSRAR